MMNPTTMRLSTLCCAFGFAYWYHRRYKVFDARLQAMIRDLELGETKPNDPKIIVKRLEEAKGLKKVAKQRSLPCFNDRIAVLKSRILSTKYRLNIEQRNQNIDQNQFNALKTMAGIWKTKEPLIKDNELTPEEIQQLKEVCAYPKFAKLLLKSASVRASFLEWCIRTHNKAAPFVEFIGMAKKLVESNISMRIGAFGGNDLQIKSHGNDKDLTLPFEGVHRSILHEQGEVPFKGNYKLKISQIFQVFLDRNYTIGDLEYFPHEGICNWNPKKLGWYNFDSKKYEMIDLGLGAPKWWEQLKPMEVISKEQASNRFENFEGKKLVCDGLQWVGTLISRTDYHLPDVQGNHAYVQFAIPDGNGNYRLYDFGKFTDWFPRTLRERLDFVAKPVKGSVTYPDENRFRLDRDVESVSFLFSPAEGTGRMNSIRKDLLRIREGNFYFEVLNDNCIKWAAKKLNLSQEQTHKMCGVRLIDGHPRGPLGKIWTILKICPGVFHRVFFSTLFVMMGARATVQVMGKLGKIKVKCLMHNPPWAHGAIRPHPTVLLINKREAKKQNE